VPIRSGSELLALDAGKPSELLPALMRGLADQLALQRCAKLDANVRVVRQHDVRTPVPIEVAGGSRQDGIPSIAPRPDTLRCPRPPRSSPLRS